MQSAPSCGRAPRLLLGTASALAVITLALATQQARATTLNVSASVPADCSVQTGTLAFGNYTPAANKDVTGSFTVTCSVDADLLIGLDEGQNLDSGLRHVQSNGSKIPYLIYRESARNTEWGNDDGFSSPKRSVSIQGGDVPRNVDVYGRLITIGPMPAGVYTDVVNITFSVN